MVRPAVQGVAVGVICDLPLIGTAGGCLEGTLHLSHSQEEDLWQMQQTG